MGSTDEVLHQNPELEGGRKRKMPMADTVANTCSEFQKVLADENQEMVSE